VDAKNITRPRGDIAVEIVRGVGKGREQQNLAIVRVDWRANLFGDHTLQCGKLGVPLRRDKPSGREECLQSVAIFDEILPPTNTIDILEKHLDLPADEQGLEGRIVDIDVVDGKFLNRVVVGVDLGEQ